MAALTGEIYILAPRYQLVSGHGTTCPYDTPLKVTTITKPIATTKSQSGRYVCFANSIYCLTAIRYVAEATRYAPAVREILFLSKKLQDFLHIPLEGVITTHKNLVA